VKRKLKSGKEQICAALDVAYEKVLVEQDVYRERLDGIEVVSEDKVIENLAKLGWEDIAEIMKNERYPACCQDRTELLDQQWDEIPPRIRIEQIEDKDIRCQTYFLNEVAEQRDRIRAMAVFFETIGVSHNSRSSSTIIFNLWTRRSIYLQLSNELVGLNEEESNSMRSLAEAMEEVIDILARNGESDLL